MFDKFDLWKYSELSNCWDYVRAFLKERENIDLPEYGILPTDKKAMTKAYKELKGRFVECGPEQNAVACQYHGKLMVHVGVVDGGYIRHTSSQKGTTKEKIKDFERIRTRYFKYADA